jgi:ferric-dicitrate binding protein FerR (iron transport regulator)
MVIAHTSDQQLQVSAADIITQTAWTQGELGFKGKSLGEILDDLENWYGVTITVDKKIDLGVRISGEFNNESLENILSGISFSLNYEYTIQGKKVFITRKE